MKILAFAASNSRKSINQQLVKYAAGLCTNDQVEVLDINDYEMPIYSSDREEALPSLPEQAQLFFSKITQADALIISFAEHNGSYTAAYKNLFDWASRIDSKVFQNKAMLLLSTSPGPGGAASVLAAAKASAPYFAGDVKSTLSIPSFYENFDLETQLLKNSELQQQLKEALNSLNS
jgi:NAD(P)H-dependent FMN reductase